MKRQMFASLLWVLWVISPVSSCGTPDNPCGDDWSTFDYSDSSSDVGKVPPDMLDLDRVFAEGRGDDLSLEQIRARINDIPNLKDVNRDHMISILQENGINLVYNVGTSLALKDGVLKTAEGFSTQIDKDFHSKGKFSVEENGKIIFSVDNEKENLNSLNIPLPGPDEIYTIRIPPTVTVNYLDGAFAVSGDVSFVKGELYVELKDKAVINGVLIDAYSGYVDICNVKGCSDASDFNGIYFGEKLIGKGSGFSIEFLDDPRQSYFQVYSDYTKSRLPYFWQNDKLKFDIGRIEEKGYLEVVAQESQLPVVKTDGWVRIENDDNTVTVNGKNVKKELFQHPQGAQDTKLTEPKKEIFPSLWTSEGWDVPQISSEIAIEKRGAVPLELQPVQSNLVNHFFDNNKNVHTMSSIVANAIKEERSAIWQEHGISMDGYFSAYELSIFSKQLEIMRERLDLDFKKFTKLEDGRIYPVVIVESDNSISRGPGDDNVEAFVNGIFPHLIFWTPTSDLKNPEISVKAGESPSVESLLEYYGEEIFTHEFGHVIEGLLNPATISERYNEEKSSRGGPLMDSFVSTLPEIGLQTKPRFNTNGLIIRYNIVDKTPFMFPSKHSEKDVQEYIAETFAIFVHNPGWFEGNDLPSELSEEEKVKIVENRKKIKGIFERELTPFKRSVP